MFGSCHGNWQGFKRCDTDRIGVVYYVCIKRMPCSRQLAGLFLLFCVRNNRRQNLTGIFFKYFFFLNIFFKRRCFQNPPFPTIRHTSKGNTSCNDLKPKLNSARVLEAATAKESERDTKQHGRFNVQSRGKVWPNFVYHLHRTAAAPLLSRSWRYHNFSSSKLTHSHLARLFKQHKHQCLKRYNSQALIGIICRMIFRAFHRTRKVPFFCALLF